MKALSFPSNRVSPDKNEEPVLFKNKLGFL